MILDRLGNAGIYRSIHPLFGQAFQALQKEDWSKYKDGRYDLVGQQLYVLVQRYNSRPRQQGKWEAHRRYIDIQYVAQGAEQFGWADRDSMRIVEPYDDTKDVMFLDAEGSFLKLAAGSFIIFHPQDAHMPGLALTTPQPVLKVVAKVAVE